MNILNNPINTFSFSDIAQFCEEGLIEGVQLDYKRELPAKGLAKHFASFSNTRGGVLIIGVEEDSKTGKPVAWEGISSDAKLVDRIHQYATSVEPRPAYDVHVTDKKQEKVFILVRVFEGDRTPYYVQNDANLYIRTGNITDPISLASPEAAELLFGKKTKADLVRENYVLRTVEIFKAATKRADKERLQAIAIEKEKWKREQQPESKGGFSTSLPTDPLGTNSAMCSILLQPFFPKAVLTTPQEILAKADKFRVTGRYQERFPGLNLKPIQDGVLVYEWGRTGYILCHQLYATGLLYDTANVLRIMEGGIKAIQLTAVATQLVMFLRVASNLFQLFNYQGGLKGFLRLENIEGAFIYPVLPEGYQLRPFFFEDNKGALLSKYEWELDLDTTLLHDPMSRQIFFIEKITELYWTLGYETVQPGIIEKFLEGYGWLVK
jgi:Putative DNA-binding domain